MDLWRGKTSPYFRPKGNQTPAKTSHFHRHTTPKSRPKWPEFLALYFAVTSPATSPAYPEEASLGGYDHPSFYTLLPFSNFSTANQNSPFGNQEPQSQAGSKELLSPISDFFQSKLEKVFLWHSALSQHYIYLKITTKPPGRMVYRLSTQISQNTVTKRSWVQILSCTLFLFNLTSPLIFYTHTYQYTVCIIHMHTQYTHTLQYTYYTISLSISLSLSLYISLLLSLFCPIFLLFFNE